MQTDGQTHITGPTVTFCSCSAYVPNKTYEENITMPKFHTTTNALLYIIKY